VPVDFLTPEQRARYGCYGEDPTPEQLARCFHLTNDDRELIDKGQSDRARLGCAVQLGTVRFLGTFLADQTDVPTVVVDHLAAQLGIADPSALKGYGETAMRFKHAAAIRERVGYSDFNDQPGHWRFIRWLYTRAYVAGERHIVLFDLSTVRLVEAKILLPAASTLERLIATVKERAATQLWRALGAIPDEETGKRLLALLVVHPGHRRQSTLDRIRRAPTSPSIDGLVGGLRRLEEILGLGARQFNLGRIPQGRIDAMARYVAKAKAAEIEPMPVERRIAHLVAYTATAPVAGRAAREETASAHPGRPRPGGHGPAGRLVRAQGCRGGSAGRPPGDGGPPGCRAGRSGGGERGRAGPATGRPLLRGPPQPPHPRPTLPAVSPEARHL